MLEDGQMVVLNVQDILPNRFQPRIHFDEVKLNELAKSIRKYGVIQPIVVRPIGNKYEIIAGERRFKANFLANRSTIPAIIVNLSDRDSEEIALLENIQRQNLTPIEEAVSYKRILDIGYITQEELAKRLGKSQSAIANKIRLLNLDDHVQDALLHGRISERHARSLLRLHNKNSQIHMLSRIINERLTVKRTDEEINKLLETWGEQKTISALPPKQQVAPEPAEVKQPVRRAVPVASHKIIKVNPPKELEEKMNEQKKQERGQGFMDIDKILQEAQDIAPKEEPVNDIAQLMKQNPSTIVSEPIHSEQAPEVQPQPQTENNKFINFGSSSSPATPTTPPAQTQDGVSFDSIFNQAPVGLQQSTPAPKEEAPSTPFYGASTQTSQPAAPTAPVNDIPFGFDVKPEPTPQQTSTVVPEVESLEMPTAQVNRETSTSNYNLNNTTPSPAPVAPASTMVAPSAPQYQTPSTPVINNVPDAEILEDPAPASMASSAPATPTMQVSETNLHGANNFRQVINLIRNCAAEIERLGYYVDVDEMDLENNYQVTFKIDKE